MDDSFTKIIFCISNKNYAIKPAQAGPFLENTENSNHERF